MKFSVFFLAIILFASCATNKPWIEEKGVFSSEKFSKRILTHEDSLTFKSIENPLDRWKAHGIKNYNYEAASYMPRPLAGNYLISVRDDTLQKISSKDYDTGQFLEIEKNRWEELSHFRALTNYKDWLANQKAEEIKVRYDSVYGYPISTMVVYTTKYTHGFTSFSIHSLEILD